jgi:hypothetical protein
MAKYDALRDELARTGSERVAMTFAEIEHLIGRRLPVSAWNYSWWWGNKDGQTPFVQSLG